MSPRSFLWHWISSLAALAALVVLVNIVVDPYDVFGTPRIARFNAIKPNARDHSMLTKTYQLDRVHPATVVIGSSVVYLGIDAFSPAWPATMRPIYNYGIPGGNSAWTSLRMLQEAVNAGGVRDAIVFLDFQNFFVDLRPTTEVTEEERRFRFTADGRSNPYRPLQEAKDMVLAAATMPALIDSITTVLEQRRGSVLNMAPDGSSTEADFVNAARADGMHDLFAQKDSVEAERVDRIADSVLGWQGPLPNLDSVSQMIRFAQARGVKLTLVLAPRHADALEIYWHAGLWPKVEQLKAQLAGLVANQGGVTLWDFLDYSSFTTEAVPPSGDRRTPTRWFWEPTHFKKQLGEVMIQRMFGHDRPAFGIVLTPENLAEHNAYVRAERAAVVCEQRRVGLADTEACAKLEKAQIAPYVRVGVSP